MTPREPTLQQRDTLAALVGRPISYFAGLGLPVYALVSTWSNRDSIVHPALAAVALLLVALAAGSLVWLSSPLRAPFTARSLVYLVAVVLLAFVVSAISMGENDAAIRDDWGGPVVGLLILALAPYRPAKDLAVAGVLGAILVGVVALVQAEDFVAPYPPIMFVVIATAPILALSLASASFAHVLVRGLDRWNVRARLAVTELADERGRFIARSVQQDAVTILNQQVVPFLSGLRDSDRVTEETRQRARSIADVVRASMVAGVDRSWLDDLLIDAAGAHAGTPVGSAAPTVALSDPSGLARKMTTDERTALRALIVAVHGHPSFDPGASTITIAERAGRSDVVVRAGLADTTRAERARLAPFIAVARVIFADLHVDHDSPVLTLRFSYEQR
jgi:hypothetical protein